MDYDKISKKSSLVKSSSNEFFVKQNSRTADSAAIKEFDVSKLSIRTKDAFDTLKLNHSSFLNSTKNPVLVLKDLYPYMDDEHLPDLDLLHNLLTNELNSYQFSRLITDVIVKLDDNLRISLEEVQSSIVTNLDWMRDIIVNNNDLDSNPLKLIHLYNTKKEVANEYALWFDVLTDAADSSKPWTSQMWDMFVNVFRKGTSKLLSSFRSAIKDPAESDVRDIMETLGGMPPKKSKSVSFSDYLKDTISFIGGDSKNTTPSPQQPEETNQQQPEETNQQQPEETNQQQPEDAPSSTPTSDVSPLGYSKNTLKPADPESPTKALFKKKAEVVLEYNDPKLDLKNIFSEFRNNEEFNSFASDSGLDVKDLNRLSDNLYVGDSDTIDSINETIANLGKFKEKLKSAAKYAQGVVDRKKSAIPDLRGNSTLLLATLVNSTPTIDKYVDWFDADSKKDADHVAKLLGIYFSSKQNGSDYFDDMDFSVSSESEAEARSDLANVPLIKDGQSVREYLVDVVLPEIRKKEGASSNKLLAYNFEDQVTEIKVKLLKKLPKDENEYIAARLILNRDGLWDKLFVEAHLPSGVVVEKARKEVVGGKETDIPEKYSTNANNPVVSAGYVAELNSLHDISNKCDSILKASLHSVASELETEIHSVSSEETRLSRAVTQLGSQFKTYKVSVDDLKTEWSSVTDPYNFEQYTKASAPLDASLKTILEVLESHSINKILFPNSGDKPAHLSSPEHNERRYYTAAKMVKDSVPKDNSILSLIIRKMYEKKLNVPLLEFKKGAFIDSVAAEVLVKELHEKSMSKDETEKDTASKELEEIGKKSSEVIKIIRKDVPSNARDILTELFKVTGIHTPNYTGNDSIPKMLEDCSKEESFPFLSNIDKGRRTFIINVFKEFCQPEVYERVIKGFTALEPKFNNKASESVKLHTDSVAKKFYGEDSVEYRKIHDELVDSGMGEAKDNSEAPIKDVIKLLKSGGLSSIHVYESIAASLKGTSTTHTMIKSILSAQASDVTELAHAIIEKKAVPASIKKGLEKLVGTTFDAYQLKSVLNSVSRTLTEEIKIIKDNLPALESESPLVVLGCLVQGSRKAAALIIEEAHRTGGRGLVAAIHSSEDNVAKSTYPLLMINMYKDSLSDKEKACISANFRDPGKLLEELSELSNSTDDLESLGLLMEGRVNSNHRYISKYDGRELSPSAANNLFNNLRKSALGNNGSLVEIVSAAYTSKQSTIGDVKKPFEKAFVIGDIFTGDINDICRTGSLLEKASMFGEDSEDTQLLSDASKPTSGHPVKVGPRVLPFKEQVDAYLNLKDLLVKDQGIIPEDEREAVENNRAIIKLMEQIHPKNVIESGDDKKFAGLTKSVSDLSKINRNPSTESREVTKSIRSALVALSRNVDSTKKINSDIADADNARMNLPAGKIGYRPADVPEGKKRNNKLPEYYNAHFTNYQEASSHLAYNVTRDDAGNEIVSHNKYTSGSFSVAAFVGELSRLRSECLKSMKSESNPDKLAESLADIKKEYSGTLIERKNLENKIRERVQGPSESIVSNMDAIKKTMKDLILTVNEAIAANESPEFIGMKKSAAAGDRFKRPTSDEKSPSLKFDTLAEALNKAYILVGSIRAASAKPVPSGHRGYNRENTLPRQPDVSEVDDRPAISPGNIDGKRYAQLVVELKSTIVEAKLLARKTSIGVYGSIDDLLNNGVSQYRLTKLVNSVESIETDDITTKNRIISLLEKASKILKSSDADSSDSVESRILYAIIDPVKEMVLSILPRSEPLEEKINNFISSADAFLNSAGKSPRDLVTLTRSVNDAKIASERLDPEKYMSDIAKDIFANHRKPQLVSTIHSSATDDVNDIIAKITDAYIEYVSKPESDGGLTDDEREDIEETYYEVTGLLHKVADDFGTGYKDDSPVIEDNDSTVETTTSEGRKKKVPVKDIISYNKSGFKEASSKLEMYCKKNKENLAVLGLTSRTVDAFISKVGDKHTDLLAARKGSTTEETDLDRYKILKKAESLLKEATSQAIRAFGRKAVENNAWVSEIEFTESYGRLTGSDYADGRNIVEGLKKLQDVMNGIKSGKGKYDLEDFKSKLMEISKNEENLKSFTTNGDASKYQYQVDSLLKRARALTRRAYDLKGLCEQSEAANLLGESEGMDKITLADVEKSNLSPEQAHKAIEFITRRDMWVSRYVKEKAAEMIREATKMFGEFTDVGMKRKQLLISAASAQGYDITFGSVFSLSQKLKDSRKDFRKEISRLDTALKQEAAKKKIKKFEEARANIETWGKAATGILHCLEKAAILSSSAKLFNTMGTGLRTFYNYDDASPEEKEAIDKVMESDKKVMLKELVHESKGEFSADEPLQNQVHNLKQLAKKSARKFKAVVQDTNEILKELSVVSTAQSDLEKQVAEEAEALLALTNPVYNSIEVEIDLDFSETIEEQMPNATALTPKNASEDKEGVLARILKLAKQKITSLS